MADFCTQCSIEDFGEDYGDFAGLSTPQHPAKGEYALVLCEGCGITYVDHTGKCVTPDCLKSHGKKEKQNAETPDQNA